MRAVVQRVSRAKVTVDGEITGEILAGVLVLLGVSGDDAETDADYLLDKIVNLRIFDDADGKMNWALLDAGVRCLSSPSSLYTAILAEDEGRHLSKRLQRSVRISFTSTS